MAIKPKQMIDKDREVLLLLIFLIVISSIFAVIFRKYQMKTNDIAKYPLMISLVAKIFYISMDFISYLFAVEIFPALQGYVYALSTCFHVILFVSLILSYYLISVNRMGLVMDYLAPF